MNKFIGVGNLTKDPELRTTNTGTPVCTFSIAIQRKFANRDGEKVTDFFDIVAWRTLAETCAKYLSKGKKISVVGEIQFREYEANDGSKRRVTEVNADEIEFLSPKEKASAKDPLEGFTEVPDEQFPF